MNTMTRGGEYDFIKSAVVGLVSIALWGCSSAAPLQQPFTPVAPRETVTYTEFFAPRDLYHEVAPMETLWRISQMYGVDQQVIVDANHLTDPTALSVGQKLLIVGARPMRPVIPLYDTRQWSYMVIHHSATEQGNALAIAASHERRGFGSGMGYHFLIDNGTLGKTVGQIEVGPRWIKQEDGAHANAAGMNVNGIGIALVGNFSEIHVPEAQLDSLVFLVQTLSSHYGIPSSHVIRHSDVPGKNTECPGKYFPWQDFMRRLQESG